MSRPFGAKLGRHQYVIDRQLLAPLGPNWTLSEVQLRRDRTLPIAQVAGVLHVEVFASTQCPRPADAPAPEFAGNRGPDFRQVFASDMQFPALAAGGPVPAPWTAPDAIRIPFAAPMSDGGGNVLLEFVTSEVTGQPRPDWVLDFVRRTAAGTATAFGVTCSTTHVGTIAEANTESLRPGTTAEFFLIEAPRFVPVVHVLGLSDQSFAGMPLPFDLAPLGAPGCLLYTDLFVLQPTGVVSAPRFPFGNAQARVTVPLDPSLLAGTVFSQWLLLEPWANALMLTTSNAVRARLAATPADLGVAQVWSRDPSASGGIVTNNLAPVLRLLR